MIQFRKAHPALTTGETELIALPEPLIGWRRWRGDDRVVAIFNLSAEPVTLSGHQLPQFETAAELGFTTAPRHGQLNLPPFGISIGSEHGNGQRR